MKQAGLTTPDPCCPVRRADPANATNAQTFSALWMSNVARSRSALPWKCAQEGRWQKSCPPGGSGKGWGGLGVKHLALCSPRQQSPWRPQLLLPDCSLAPASPEDRRQGLGRPGLAAGRDPTASAARGPCLYLVDVAVGAAADALNQLEVLLRVPAGQIEAGVHGGPQVPPASLPGRGGGPLRGPHGERAPRPAPGSPGGHNHPAPRCGRRRRRRSPHAAADDDKRPIVPAPRGPPRPAAAPNLVTPTRRGEPSQPLARGETPTWLPLSPLLPLPLLRLLQPPPLFPTPARLRSRDPGGSAPGLARTRPLARSGSARLPGRGRRRNSLGPETPRLFCGPAPGRCRRTLEKVCLAQGPGLGLAESGFFSFLIPLTTKLDLGLSGPSSKQVA